MNYAQARQRTDGRWDWTNQNDNRVWPTGYCAGWKYDVWLKDDEVPFIPREHLEREAEQHRPFKHLYHTDGHATQEEAERCYYEYEMNHSVKEVIDASERVKHQCDYPDCTEFTNGGLALSDGGQHAFFCQEHRTVLNYRLKFPFLPNRRIIFS